MKLLPIIVIACVVVLGGVGALAVTRGQSVNAAGETGSALDDLRAYVMDHNGTERAFDNEFWNNHEAGIYVEARTGEPLFASTDKFDSGSGWPSFTQPIDVSAVREAEDVSIGMRRTEIRSARGDAHLGHVFDDGPALFGGKRYCVNSASMRFIPRAEMEAAGYGAYITLIDNPPRPTATPAPASTPG